MWFAHSRNQKRYNVCKFNKRYETTNPQTQRPSASYCRSGTGETHEIRLNENKFYNSKCKTERFNNSPLVYASRKYNMAFDNN